jgi:hypothetical protein
MLHSKPVNPKYPHIIELHDKPSKPVALWKRSSFFLMAFVLLLFAPLFGPLVLFFLFCAGVISRKRLAKIFHHHHHQQQQQQQKQQQQQETIESDSDSYKTNGKTGDLGQLRVNHHLGSVSLEQLCQQQHQLNIRKEMIENLNELQWMRADVLIPSLNSHGRVIVRSRNYLSEMVESGIDVIWHLADHMKL